MQNLRATPKTHGTFRNPTGVVVSLIVGAAMWVCICIALVWALTSCGPQPITIAPAHIVCTAAATHEVIWDATVDAATVQGGVITSVTIGADTAEFGAPQDADCEVR